MNGELPQGWTVAALKDLVGPNGMFTDGDWILSEHLRTGNDVRLIQLADVGIGHFLDKSQKFISRETAESLGVTYLQEGDVLISRMADPLARACLFPRIKKSSITAVDVAIARCDTTVTIPAYLMHLCNSHRVHIQAEGAAVGTTRKRISRKNLEQIKAPLAPLNEQRRIVWKLEKLLDRVDACQKRLAKIPILLKRFRQSVLAAACSGRLTADWRIKNVRAEPVIAEEAADVSGENLPEIPEKWRWVRLPETGEMNRGKSRHRPRNAPFLFGGPYPFIQTGDIARSSGRITTHKQTYSEAGLAQSRLWPAGTVCITIAANIAESALLTYPACFPDSVVGIIANPKVCVAEYVEFFIRVAKADLATFAPATAQKNINIAILNEVSVPLPPLAEQQEIVRRVEELFALADQIETRYIKAKACVDKLTQSILAKAFRGELIPQDPNDEPASILLERINEQKSHEVMCGNCGRVLDEATNHLPKERKPCPGCGSTSRKFEKNLKDAISVHDKVGIKGRHGKRGVRKPHIELVKGDDLHRKKNEWVNLERRIDREKDQYREVVTDKKTGSIIHRCEEPLSKHQGRGSAKRKDNDKMGPK